MAKILEQAENTKKSAKNAKNQAVEIASHHNLIGLDPDQLSVDVRKIIDLSDALKEDGTELSDHKKHLKAERGYHMGGFAACVKLERMEPAEARDWWLTVKTYAKHAGLDTPDLVDMAEAGRA